MTSPTSRRTVLAAGLAGTATALTGSPAAAQPDAPAPAQANLSFPSTRLTREARHLVSRTQETYLRNHSLRSFLFARAAAEQAGQQPGQDYDVELTFLICALHDMGLTASASSNQRFEVAGADFAAQFLEQRGVTDSRVDTVWDAIALHTSPTYQASPVFRRRRAPEIGIAIDGIGIDVVGINAIGGPDTLPPGYVDRVHAVYPRLGGARTLTDAIVRHAMSDPRKAPPMTFPGEVLHQRRPDLPYQTWDMILDAAGWGD
ncbi:HD domain-containing protein [Kibdelosporangium persicum]|uniref:Metal dependent phosphohydrolase n=1 Tax=Kibdelosporangium persicum TaxID=2698649 RepID=A0ABX2FDA0_9PSEU|nr:HD domain-containing protein [Kibdelosporangium persicum]NRN69183.1 Metal dependent phosphohydrolase [Kibdelosporangium persicum]